METTGNPSINVSLCLFCQLQREEEVVENPSSYETLLEAIGARARYGETKYVEIWANLKDLSSHDLKVKGATWHRKCYQEATHSGMVKRSKERLVLTGNLNFDRNDCNFLVTIFQLPIITREGSKYRLLYKV